MRILLISECYPSCQKTQYCVFLKQQFDELHLLGNDVDILVPVRGGVGSGLSFSEDITGDRYYLPYTTDRYMLRLTGIAKRIALQMNNLLEKAHYDLISVHITSDFILKAAVMAAGKHNIPVVQHYHGLNVFEEYDKTHRLRQKFYGKRRQRLLKSVACAVGVSNKVSEIIEKACPSLPVHTVYNGVNVECFFHGERPHSELRILGVGNLIPIKGFEYLLRAFAKIKDRISDAELHIIGEGQERGKLEKLAQELAIDNKTFFHGALPYKDVAEWMCKSDIFVLPSYYEALGCVYLEAMASELPTIGVKGMGIDEIIKDGENGFLVSPHCSDEIADILIKLADNKQMRESIGKQARLTAEKYTWEASSAKLLKIYKGCVAKNESVVSHR